MHDIAVANQVVEVVVDAARDKKGSLQEIRVTVGELLLLSAENLAFWIEELLKQQGITAKACVSVGRASISCQCGYLGQVDVEGLGHTTYLLECPKCRNREVEEKSGKQITVDRIILED